MGGFHAAAEVAQAVDRLAVGPRKPPWPWMLLQSADFVAGSEGGHALKWRDFGNTGNMTVSFIEPSPEDDRGRHRARRPHATRRGLFPPPPRLIPRIAFSSGVHWIAVNELRGTTAKPGPRSVFVYCVCGIAVVSFV
jgi:hypothetical protein